MPQVKRMRCAHLLFKQLSRYSIIRSDTVTVRFVFKSYFHESGTALELDYDNVNLILH